MFQSTATNVNEHQTEAVAELGTTLPQIAAKRKYNSPTSPRVCCDQKLPDIGESKGNTMMSLLIGRRMERSNSPSDLRVVVYESLEQKRAHKIGVKPLRNFDVTRSRKAEPTSGHHSLPPIMTASTTSAAPCLQPMQTSIDLGLKRNNTLAPFGTLAPKPTCGYFFNRETLNKKVRIGVPPSDLVKWRTDYSLFPQPQKQG